MSATEDLRVLAVRVADDFDHMDTVLSSLQDLLEFPDTDDAHWVLGQVYETLNIPIPGWLG